MRVLIAPDKFKDCLTAEQVADAMAAGMRRAFPDAAIDLCPLSDGGEGFVDTMFRARGGERITRRVTGPLPERKVDATFLLLPGEPKTAVIEMSSASGLALVPIAERNPLATTTFGTGELMMHAVALGARKILLGIGGSATCDGGVGCLQACGCHVILQSGEYATMSEPLCGRDLDDILTIKSHRGSPIDGVEIVVACDVDNPLTGPIGAARAYGPQKAATPDDVERLDRALTALAARLNKTDAAVLPGSGAAGGLGFGLRALLSAKIERGFEVVADAVGLHDRLAAADLVLSGEGRYDATSASGKAAYGVSQLAAEMNKRCVLIVGDREGEESADILALTDHADRARALTNAATLITELTSSLPRYSGGGRGRGL